MPTTPPPASALDSLATMDGYRRLFFDADHWAPYVRWVARKHIGIDDPTIGAGLVGTYPTFIVNDAVVVKFYGALFAGEATHAAELAVALSRPEGLAIPAPRMVAHGSLYDGQDGWRWPYIVFEFAEGVSIGEAHERVSHRDRTRIAHDVGAMARAFHDAPIPGEGPFDPTWDAYTAFLDTQRARCAENHREWGDLSAHLIEQIDDFLAPTSELVDRARPPHLIHADMTADHILGVPGDDGWRTTGLIDFGDAMVGDHLYELVALHLDMFRCDKSLLAAYLDAYGVDEDFRRSLPHRAMSTTLLHQFDVCVTLPGRVAGLDEITGLAQLADAIWGLPQAH
jgi:hygromycin-B 7''-O-kinase